MSVDRRHSFMCVFLLAHVSIDQPRSFPLPVFFLAQLYVTQDVPRCCCFLRHDSASHRMSHAAVVSSGTPTNASPGDRTLRPLPKGPMKAWRSPCLGDVALSHPCTVNLAFSFNESSPKGNDPNCPIELAVERMVCLVCAF